MNETYIKLYRKFADWGWFTEVPVCHLFVYLLLKAQYNEKEFKGIKVAPGELTTSLEIMSTESGLSVKQIRTALKKLEETGEVARLGARKYTHLKIIKWADYQGLAIEEGKIEGTERALKGQQEGTERATIKEYKESKNINIKKEIYKEKKSVRKHKHGEYQNVLLSDDEYNKLFQEYPNAQELITYLDEYIEMKGYSAKSHYLAIKKWVVDAVARDNKKKAETTETYNPFLKMLMEEENGTKQNSKDISSH